MHNQSRSLQTYRSFNQLISNHLKDFTLDDIQTIKDAKDLKVASDPLRKAGVRVLAVGIGWRGCGGGRRLYRPIIWFCPDQDHRKGVIKVWLRVVSYFSFGHGRMRARASGEAARNEGWLIYFSPYIGVRLVLVFLLSSVLFHNHQILMASLAFFSLNTVPYYRQHWRWVK